MKGRLHIAIVGAGPGGFYAAEALLRANRGIAVDMFERLPVPFGLVRFGVAPDHPKLKQVTTVFERIAAMPDFRFIGGVEIGTDFSIDTLRQSYHAVILATGAALGRSIGLAGEHLPGCHQASDFVGWYNGHPDHRRHSFDFSSERAVVVGHGNVALDIARILVKTPDELRHTDIASHALDALAESRIREVHIVGRGGPAQTRFSAKELQEFTSLDACDPAIVPEDLPEDAFIPQDGMDAERSMALRLLQSFSSSQSAAKVKRCFFRFNLSPVSFEGSERLQRVLFCRREQTNSPPLTLESGLTFLSVGRKTTPLHGVPYDSARGLHAHQDGRIIGEGHPVTGLYVCGWSKRGPQGTIGTNRACAVDTVERLFSDIDTLLEPAEGARERLLSEIDARQGIRLDFAAWRAIDQTELARGLAKGKPREKFTSVDEMMLAARRKEIAC
ncbi:FAD-dependent oxidoreductase [Rhizobium sp.]|jgi:ferredoxin/flavodoxin---NADP+ reductase|uniref:FAD-dependent oxidoreductase n=1 Tax=Rhizobium sp. TaxID=391 RepID=UPI000E8F9812|nr:pyridine nucleotide-disulfide oxidoreductase [Rhizobium sp.]